MADVTSGGAPPPAGGPTHTDELFAEALGITPTGTPRSRRGAPGFENEMFENDVPGVSAPPQIPPAPGQSSPSHGSPSHGSPSHAAPGRSTRVSQSSAATETSKASPTASSWLSRRRARVHRTHRILRHIDPWSVFKVSVLLYACLYVAVLAAGVLLWNAAQRSGLVDKLESFIAEVGSYESWSIDGMVIFSRARIIGLIVATVGVAVNVLMTIMFNLISDLTGGVRVTVLEDDRRTPAR